MNDEQRVSFIRLPIGVACPVPVLPGTPDTMRAGEAIPIEERTEKCCVNAYWMIGGQVCCDIHLKVACELLDIDYQGLCDEAGGSFTSEETPWEQRSRYPQDDPTLSMTDDLAARMSA